MKPKIKIRKQWTRHPAERIKDSAKKYNRNEHKQELRKYINEKLVQNPK